MGLRTTTLLKEYAGVIVAVVTVVAALGALGLWAIDAQVTPEIARLEGRIDLHEVLLKQIDRKIDTNLKVINDRFDRVEKDMDDRFNRVRALSEERFPVLSRVRPAGEAASCSTRRWVLWGVLRGPGEAAVMVGHELGQEGVGVDGLDVQGLETGGTSVTPTTPTTSTWALA